MHSSRMRTARLLDVSPSAGREGVSAHRGGIYLGVSAQVECLPRGCLPMGVSTGGVYPGVSTQVDVSA